MPLAEPYLTFGGAELMNSLRTLTYLRRGLGGSQFEVHVASPLTPESGYSDTYSDIYEADPFWPGNLGCYCALLDTGPFVSPSADPAPWRDPARPESAEFFGLMGDMRVSEVAVRGSQPRSTGGATVGRRRLKPRLLQVKATMFAASTAAMGWGERWLAQALAGSNESCGGPDAQLLLACPPDSVADPDTYRRNLAEVGLVDGPVFEGIDGVGACFAEDVSFQLLAGQPYLRAPAVDCIPRTNLRDFPTTSCTLTGPALVGDTAARITVAAGHVGSSLQNVTITAKREACPSSADVDVTYPVLQVPRGYELVIDSSTRSVRVQNALTGEVVGGADALDTTDALQWVVAAPGEEICIEVDASGATLNSGSLIWVEAIGREL